MLFDPGGNLRSVVQVLEHNRKDKLAAALVRLGRVLPDCTGCRETLPTSNPEGTGTAATKESKVAPEQERQPRFLPSDQGWGSMNTGDDADLPRSMSRACRIRRRRRITFPERHDPGVGRKSAPDEDWRRFGREYCGSTCPENTRLSLPV